MGKMGGSLQEQASELSLALAWGLVELDDVTRWADCIILECEEVDAKVCDVSLATNAKSALAGLNELAQDSPLWPAAARALRRMLDIEDLSPKFAATLAKQVYFLGMRKDAPEGYQNLMHHWDYLDRAIDGIVGVPEEATRAFVQDVSALVERVTDT